MHHAHARVNKTFDISKATREYQRLIFELNCKYSYLAKDISLSNYPNWIKDYWTLIIGFLYLSTEVQIASATIFENTHYAPST